MEIDAYKHYVSEMYCEDNKVFAMGNNFVIAMSTREPDTHAEAALLEMSYKIHTMHVNATPCSACAKAIIEHGVKKVTVFTDHPYDISPRWACEQDTGLFLLVEAGVDVRFEKW